MCFAPLICKQPPTLNFELVGTQHCLWFLLFINGYKARNKQKKNLKKKKSKPHQLQADRRPRFNESSQNMHGIEPLNVFYCGGQMLGQKRRERKQKTATTYQTEMNPEVNFLGFSHGYGPLCIISASCVAASMQILQSGKHHRHKKPTPTKKPEALSESITYFWDSLSAAPANHRCTVTAGMRRGTETGTALCDEKVYF